jgi:5-methylcytosine-specific restriction protein A
MDRQIVQEFPELHRSELASVAAVVRTALAEGARPDEILEDEVFLEGEILTTRHRQRERRLRLRLLQRIRPNPLVCEICDFSPPALERDLQESFFEAHHVIPLAHAEGRRATRVSDMSLLCAGCHRFIHRMISRTRVWVGIAEAREIRRSA